MWTYRQTTGELLHNSTLVARGYSGHEEGYNNSSLQRVRCVGPIPQGEWTFQGPPFDSQSHGPFVLHIVPKADTNTFGRSGFLLHGDSVSHPGLASEGCIIMPRPVREQVWNSGDRDLEVVA
jgi:hypothetical protein